ncbi:hypothetical protein Vadar_005799 [Vaccinium darrowii]|uniref:Uncharacterized protein n=1 Tax=Vaccinium darrowii TaxID=229202 RepID=A0ACB7XNG7_9ERIC|nr:hypothetical protein Vadar_005799 [Vaccinium darrowii]
MLLFFYLHGDDDGMFEQFDADRCLPHFTIKMYYDGCFESGNYVGGTFGFIDFCQEDEVGIMEICAIAKELSGGFSNDYYLRLNGPISIIKSDTDALRMCQLVDSNRLVEVYAVSNMVILPTQCSQVGSGSASASANQTKRKEKPTIDIDVDCNAKGKDTCLMVEEEDEDTDDYDPESESSAEEFEDSDCAIEEDDELFGINVDMEAEYGGVGDQTVAHDEHADLADLDDTSDDSDELVSLGSESDSDGGGKKQKNKYPVFDEHADMLNLVFSVGMEFKTHEIFTDAVKEHAIKFGKKIKFVKIEKQKVSGICLAKGCPFSLRIKHYIANHSCSREYNVPHVSAKWIVKRYGERIGKNPTWPIQSLADTIEFEWTVHVDRQKVFRAKRRALAMLEARATTVPAFTKAMSEMKNIDKNAFDWLNARPRVNWSRSHFDTFPKCDILLNNLCESFNSAILPARDKPIITLLERIEQSLWSPIKKEEMH